MVFIGIAFQEGIGRIIPYSSHIPPRRYAIQVGSIFVKHLDREIFVASQHGVVFLVLLIPCHCAAVGAIIDNNFSCRLDDVLG